MANETIEAVVSKVFFTKANSAKSLWMIMQTSIGTAKGSMSWTPKPDERLLLTGEWKLYNGQKEFSFTMARPSIPVDRRAMLNYICTITKGFGETLEDKIWEKYGETWLDIKPLEVAGLTPVKWNEFSKSLEYLHNNAAEANTVSWLMDKGLTQNMAQKAWEMWNDKTISKTKDNPYNLTELPRVGFLAVDQRVRVNFDVSDDDPRRIEAGTFYAMEQLMAGATTCRWQDLTMQINNNTLRNVERKKIIDIIGSMLHDGKLVGFKQTGMVATRRDYENEKKIWEYMNCA